MNLIDRYIARQFLFNVLALFVILFSFVVAIDVSLNIDRFLKAATDIAAEQGRTLAGLPRLLAAAWLVFDWWWPRLLMLFNFLLGIIMIGAMGFTLSQMARHRELVALLAGGVSLHRAGRPVVLAALGLTGLAVVNQELILPPIAPLLTRDHSDAGRAALASRSLPLTPDSRGRVFAARRFDAVAETLDGVYILERDPSGVALRAITAPRARWRDGAWLLESPRVESRRPGAEPDSTADRIETDLDPTALRMKRSAAYSQNLGTLRLTELLRRPGLLDPRARDQIERIRLGRFAAMAANILTLITALPFFLSRTPGDQVLRSLLCAPIAIAGVIGSAMAGSAAIPGLPVWLSVSVPLLILLPVAVAMASAMKT